MRERSHLTPSRWMLALTSVFAVMLLSACGRVDLEDLTPEAFKTQQAQEAANQPTPTEESADGSPGTDGGGGVAAPQGDVAAGASIYNSQCSGCHEGGRAESILGKVFDPAVEIPKLRSGEGFAAPHPKYALTDIRPLLDDDFNDIFAYLASQ